MVLYVFVADWPWRILAFVAGIVTAAAAAAVAIVSLVLYP